MRFQRVKKKTKLKFITSRSWHLHKFNIWLVKSHGISGYRYPFAWIFADTDVDKQLWRFTMGKKQKHRDQQQQPPRMDERRARRGRKSEWRWMRLFGVFVAHAAWTTISNRMRLNLHLGIRSVCPSPPLVHEIVSVVLLSLFANKLIFWHDTRTVEAQKKSRPKKRKWNRTQSSKEHDRKLTHSHQKHKPNEHTKKRTRTNNFFVPKK